MDNHPSMIDIAVEWDPAILIEGEQVRGQVALTKGKLVHAEFTVGQGNVRDGQFTFVAGDRVRLCLTIADADFLLEVLEAALAKVKV